MHLKKMGLPTIFLYIFVSVMGPYVLVAVLISPIDWSLGRDFCHPVDFSRRKRKAPGAPPGPVAL